MPLMACTIKDKPGFKYGESGHCYTYTVGNEESRRRAKQLAILQGTAIAQSTGEKLVVELEKSKTIYNDEKNLIFGWGYVALNKNREQVIDHSGERVEPKHLEELEMAVYGFNIGSRKANFDHKGLDKGYLIESVFLNEEKMEKMGIPKGILPQGAWVGFWFPNDEDYQKIKKMKAPMFSIEGTAIKEEV
jgi:hypothetical protein